MNFTPKKVEFNQICRCCLSQEQDLSPFNPNYLTIFVAITFRRFSKEDTFPKLICDQCSTKMNSIARFTHLCKNSFEALEELRKRNDVKVPSPPEPIEESYPEYQDENIKEEVLEEVIVVTVTEKNNDENKPDNTSNDVNQDSDSSVDKILEFPKEAPKQRVIRKVRKISITCQNCKITFLSRALREEHYKKSSSCKPASFVCEICGHNCPGADNLRKHKSKKHKEKNAFCEHCGKGYVKPEMLQEHIKNVHLTEKLYTCDQCLKTYTNYKSYWGHMERHNEQIKKASGTYKKATPKKASGTVKKKEPTPVECDICKKMFSCKSSLDTHKSIHSGDKPFLCTYCGLSYRTVVSLNSHMRTHANIKERPFHCQYCPKRFTQSAGLKTHTNIHLGLKPYKCKVCGNSFRQSHHLQGHMLMHSGKKPFQCKVCDKKFVNAGNLRVHFRIHTGEKPYKCGFCEEAFCDSGARKKHIKKVHNNGAVKIEINAKLGATIS